MLRHSVADTWVPSTDAERAIVKEQLERLLGSSYFSQSRRFPSFLRYAVEQTLDGQTEGLKERTLGIQVFGKKSDYNTTSDPIVRVTAAEIRKRIAQYYQEPGHQHEIRVLLPPGSYIPQFQLPHSVPHPDDLPIPQVIDASSTVASGLPRWSILGAIGAFVLLVAALFMPSMLSRHSGFDQFWAPFIRSSHPVLFCIADQNEYSEIALRDASDPGNTKTLQDRQIMVVIDDTIPLVNIAGLLESHGREYRVEGEGPTTLADLRQGPNVLIGAFDNAWTLRVTQGLRYHFANDRSMKQFWIEDASAPGQPKWMIDRAQQQATNNYTDYGLVARLLDGKTNQPTIVAAGVGRGGTVASGEFLTNPTYINDVMARSPRGWKRQNLEIVVKTEIIDGRSGPPHVVATYFW